MEKKFIEDLVAEIRDDYERRQAERRQFETQWQLNANFVAGNQYCRAGVKGEIEDCEKDYYWQEREVFNHIATIYETRLAKLMRVRPKMSVLPASNDDGDVKTAKASGKILSAVCENLHMNELIGEATMWSELTGTAFYKITWDRRGGKLVGRDEKGKPVYEGDVRVDVCPPYEVLPDSLAARGIEDCASVIHAKALTVDEVKRVWGKTVEAEETDVMSFSGISMLGGMGLAGAVGKIGRDKTRDRVTVIERYSRPSADKPNGELAIVAGKTLLYYGELPFINGADGQRDLPFVRQNSINRAGCFYGTDMVERAIPIQRAYNAVKNRKHEFLNRIAVGVLAVEDGSVDVDNLETEGLSPGKILVYRQGSNPPRLMSPGSVPADFTVEEQRLLDEFVDVSGISEIMRSSSVPSSVTSGVAIQMLVEQDDTRISVTAENIRKAVKATARQILRLYRSYATEPRLTRYVGDEGETELLCWSKSDIGSDDIVFDTENEINSTAATRQSMTFDLLKAGLLYDENGKLSDSTRYKILETFGYGGWERSQNVRSLHVARADKENEEIAKVKPEVSEVDDHALHVAEHIRCYLGREFNEAAKRKPELKTRMLEHIREHRAQAAAEKQIESGGNETL